MAFEIDKIRNDLHLKLIEELKQVYRSDSWKYRFLQDIEMHFGMKIGYKQLNTFEDGSSKNENITVMIISMLQIYNTSVSDILIRFSKKGSFSIQK